MHVCKGRRQHVCGDLQAQLHAYESDELAQASDLDKLSVCQSKLSFLCLDSCKTVINRCGGVLSDHFRQLSLQPLQLLLSNLLVVVLHQLGQPFCLHPAT